MTDDADLIRLGNLAADVLALRGAADMADVVRNLARRVHELRDGPEPDPPESLDAGCRGCGRPLEQPAVGRPRVWCSPPCRERHRGRSPETPQ